MVIDYRRLNDNTVDDAYDIPDKTELLNSIQGSRILSKFDCKSGSWQIRMRVIERATTRAIIHIGYYKLLQGFHNKYAFYVRELSLIL